jgi:hypothetical protein
VSIFDHAVRRSKERWWEERRGVLIVVQRRLQFTEAQRSAMYAGLNGKEKQREKQLRRIRLGFKSLENILSTVITAE